MIALAFSPGVSLKAVPPPIERMRDVLHAIAAGGRFVVPGLPDTLAVLSVSERQMNVESRGFANMACRQQFVWELRERLGPLFDVYLEGEGTAMEQFVLRRKAGA